MAITDIADIADSLPASGRLMGLDLGTKTIGLAVSDSALSIASPIGTVQRKGFETDMRALQEAMNGRDIAGLILGYPVNMDGTEGPRAKATLDFAERLTGEIDLPIALWDERLSTRAVERAMIEADMSRKKRSKKVDAAAAAFILQGAIDYLRASASRGPRL